MYCVIPFQKKNYCVQQSFSMILHFVSIVNYVFSICLEKKKLKLHKNVSFFLVQICSFNYKTCFEHTIFLWSKWIKIAIMLIEIKNNIKHDQITGVLKFVAKKFPPQWTHTKQNYWTYLQRQRSNLTEWWKIKISVRI